MADLRRKFGGAGEQGDGRPVQDAASAEAAFSEAPPVEPKNGGRDGTSEVMGVSEDPFDTAIESAEAPSVPLEQHQRLLAEFDNYRKRVERDRAREVIRARAELLEKLLPTLDDMGRARGAVATGEKSFEKDGMLIIMDRFAEVLKREGLVEVPALPGDRFDPNTHEAVLMVPSAEVPAGCIAVVLEKGYRVGDRLLRPAKVAVARAPEDQRAAAEG